MLCGAIPSRMIFATKNMLTGPTFPQLAEFQGAHWCSHRIQKTPSMPGVAFPDQGRRALVRQLAILVEKWWARRGFVIGTAGNHDAGKTGHSDDMSPRRRQRTVSFVVLADRSVPHCRPLAFRQVFQLWIRRPRITAALMGVPQVNADGAHPNRFAKPRTSA